ncbi:MAG: DMT family transporter [Candidatus Bathyarchaeia archaeon]
MSSKGPHIVFVALCLIWGSTWLGIKIGLDFLPPFTFAGLRFAAATIVLIPLVKILHGRIPSGRSSWYLMIFLGIFQLTIPYGLVFWGEQYISSGLAAVLFATLTFFVVIFAHFLANEKLTQLKAMGIVASFGGLIAIFWRDLAIQNFAIGTSFLGSIAVVGSTASAALANVVAKRYANKIDPPVSVLVQSAICSLALSALGLLTESNLPMHFTLLAIGMILYLGIIGSALAFVSLFWLFTQTTATNTSLVGFITPILALLLGWLVLGEVPDPSVWIGTALILAGVYLTLKPSGRFL